MPANTLTTIALKTPDGVKYVPIIATILEEDLKPTPDFEGGAAAFERLTDELTILRKQNNLIDQLEELGVYGDYNMARWDENGLERARLAAYKEMITQFNARPPKDSI